MPREPQGRQSAGQSTGPTLSAGAAALGRPAEQGQQSVGARHGWPQSR